MNKYLLSFGKHFLLGGLIVGIYSVITTYISPGYAAHVASSLPIVFTYIVFITYNKYGLDRAIDTSYLSSFAKNCGYFKFEDNYKCSFYKPLISSNLIN